MGIPCSKPSPAPQREGQARRTLGERLGLKKKKRGALADAAAARSAQRADLGGDGAEDSRNSRNSRAARAANGAGAAAADWGSRLTALHEEREYALEGLGSVGASVARLEAQLAKIEAIQSEGGLREGGAVAPGACGGARGACCMTLGGRSSEAACS